MCTQGGLPCGDTGTRHHLRAQERGLGRPAPATPARGRAAASRDGEECLRPAPWAVALCRRGRGWQVVLKQAQASRLLRQQSGCGLHLARRSEDLASALASDSEWQGRHPSLCMSQSACPLWPGVWPRPALPGGAGSAASPRPGAAAVPQVRCSDFTGP